MPTVNSLSDEQKAQWNQLCDDWLNTAKAGSTDRTQAEQALTTLYADCKLKPPDIIWCRSPRQLMLMPTVSELLIKQKFRNRLLSWFRGALPGPCWLTLIDDLAAQKSKLQSVEHPSGALANPLWPILGASVTETLENRLWRLLNHDSFHEAIAEEVRQYLDQSFRDHNLGRFRNHFLDVVFNAMLDSVTKERHSLKQALDCQFRDQWTDWKPAPDRTVSKLEGSANRHFNPQLDSNCHAQCMQWLRGRFDQQRGEVLARMWTMTATPWLVWMPFCQSLVPQSLTDETVLHAWQTLYTHAGGFLPFENTLFVSERPLHLSTDEQGRLHDASGPCLKYSDGFELYAWHGVNVSKQVIMQADEIAVKDIEQEPNVEVRRVMVDIYGHSRYLADSGARLIHTDPCGELYRKDFVDDEPLVMVKVKNSTPEPDGIFRHYFLRVPPEMRTAREAVAWTFQLNETFYRPSAET